MMFTTRAIEANLITQAEADALEDWIDYSLETNQPNVPDNLNELFSKVALFNTQGNLQ